MELRYFPSDTVVNTEPHQGENGFPVALNTLGLVQKVDEKTQTVTVLWSTGVTSTTSINALEPSQRPKSEQGPKSTE